MSRPFLTTVVGSMPKRPWLYRDRFALDGKKDHFGTGGAWTLEGDARAEAQDDGAQRRVDSVAMVVRGKAGFDTETPKAKPMRAGPAFQKLKVMCVGAALARTRAGFN